MRDHRELLLIIFIDFRESDVPKVKLNSVLLCKTNVTLTMVGMK